MTIFAILIALGLAFLAFRFIAGIVKFGVIALIAIVVIYFIARGGGLG
jgi:hypothetical protein